MKITDFLKEIDCRQDELYALLGDLIRINSENFANHGNEKDLAEHIHGLCLSLGLESDLYSPLSIEGFEEHPDYLPGHHLETRYNVTARMKGLEDKDELLLMAHTDTVEIGDPANWTHDPLCGQVIDGKVYGRGACDDKYALATVLFLLKLLKESGFVPKANLLFSAYSDEEHGGSHGALAAVLKYPAPNIVSMDGREDQIWHCGSGGQEACYCYHTEKIVDSAKSTAAAIPVVLEVMEEFAANRRKELAANPFYAGTAIPDTSLRYMNIRAGNYGADLGVGELCFTYYTDKTREEIYEEFHRLDQILSKRLAPLGIISDGFKPHTRFFHYVHCAPDHENIQLMLEASREATGKEPLVCGSCLSDLSVISKYGSDAAYAFGCGRDFSKEGGAHQPNEFIECDKFLAYTKTVAAYILKVLG